MGCISSWRSDKFICARTASKQEYNNFDFMAILSRIIRNSEILSRTSFPQVPNNPISVPASGISVLPTYRTLKDIYCQRVIIWRKIISRGENLPSFSTKICSIFDISNMSDNIFNIDRFIVQSLVYLSVAAGFKPFNWIFSVFVGNQTCEYGIKYSKYVWQYI